MDLAEKRRHLEEIIAAREAKQRLVHQQRHDKRKFIVSSAFSGGSLRSSVPSNNGAGVLKESNKKFSSTCCNADGVVCTDSVRCDNKVWSLQGGLGAIALESKIKEIKNDVGDYADVDAVVDSPEVSLDGASGCAKERMCDGEVNGKRGDMSLADTAMLRVHVLLAEPCLDFPGRCVLDVVVLDSSVVDDDSRHCINNESLFVAVAFSEHLYNDERSNDLSQTVSGKCSKKPVTPPKLSHLSAGVAAAVSSAEFVKSARGLVLLWLILHGKANKVVHNAVPLFFESEIRVLTYTHFCPQLLFGGAVNGSIVVWRIDHAMQGRHGALLTITDSYGSPILLSRLLSSTLSAATVKPSERSFPSLRTHHSRILAMAVHGDANYHHLYSISQDGRVCMWTLLQLRLPTSSRDGVISGQSFGWIASSAAFVDKAADAISKVIVGCFDGRVLEGRAKNSQVVEFSCINASPASVTSTLPIQQQQQRQEPQEDQSKDKLFHGFSPHNAVDDECSAHCAAVVAVAPHPLHADPRISDTVLTAGADGTCSLWLGLRRISIDGFSAHISCLRWSPKHSAVFVAGERNGRVAAWDLSQSSCFPVAFVYLSSASTSSEWTRSACKGVSTNTLSRRSAAITSLSFSDDGIWLTCGTASGEVHLLRMRSDLVTETTKVFAAVRKKSDNCSEQSGLTDATTTATSKSATSSWIDAHFML